MPPVIHVGVNLNFAKFVYGRKRAMEIVKEDFGLSHVEAVPDMDFGPIFYHSAPEAFRNYHWEIADHSERIGVHISSVLTFYRDMGAIAHPDPGIRESAYKVGLSMLEMASCYRARYASASPFTMNKEYAEDPERFQSLFDASMRIWKRWQADAHRLRLKGLLIEMAAAYREGCSTIEDTRQMLQILDLHHEQNPGTTAPVGLCYDTGHGISEDESPDPRDRDFHAWFEEFPDRILEIHLKNTDAQFQETFHFGGEEEGIIDLDDVVTSIRDQLTSDHVLVMLEVPGKRGREIGERRALEGHRRSLSLLREALERAGYRKTSDEPHHSTYAT